MILVFTVLVSFLIPDTFLRNFDLQIIAFLFVIYFLTKRFLKDSRIIESVVFCAVVSIVVITTGGSSSPFFFLLYFLLFSVSLLLDPYIALTTAFTLIVMLLGTTKINANFNNLIPIFSLAFLTPFATLIGQEYLQIQKLKTGMGKSKEDTFLFLSLVLKNHIKTIQDAVNNFLGDSELSTIKKSAKDMARLIERFEKNSE